MAVSSAVRWRETSRQVIIELCQGLRGEQVVDQPGEHVQVSHLSQSLSVLGLLGCRKMDSPFQKSQECLALCLYHAFLHALLQPFSATPCFPLMY